VVADFGSDAFDDEAGPVSVLLRGCNSPAGLFLL
jgi:hypothetical protein